LGGTVPDDFKVLAIIHTYNESDVIDMLLQYLLDQGLDVYVVDNWSTDGTYEKIQCYSESVPKRVFLERFPEGGRTEYYEWYHQLQRTEEISRKLSYQWYIHYDADEMRVSPWINVSLRDAIYYIDSLGYNLIENTVIDFKLTDDKAENLFMKDGYYDFGHKETHFLQTKTWKKSDSLQLKESGGHVAVVPEPKIFPLKILNRHYPLRSMEQAERKIFRDRKPRFEKEKRSRGWHGHYDSIHNKMELISELSGLLKWDNKSFYDYYIPLFLGCGIRIDEGKVPFEVCIPEIENHDIIIYGAGNVGKAIYRKYCAACNIVAWADKNYQILPDIYCEKICPPESLKEKKYDYIVIAIQEKAVAKSAKETLEKMGMDKGKVVYCCE